MTARAEEIAATSQEAYDAACDRFNAIASSYGSRKQALLDQLAALDREFDEASAELRKHEDHGGIPLYNRCPLCPPGRALPAGHEGKCRS